MSHGTTTRVETFIGDPLSGEVPVERETLEEIFQDIQSDLRYDHELNGCLNCGICTATCPAAHYYDFSPREIVQLLWTENLEGIYDAMQEKVWACAQCYTCAARCPSWVPPEWSRSMVNAEYVAGGSSPRLAEPPRLVPHLLVRRRSMEPSLTHAEPAREQAVGPSRQADRRAWRFIHLNRNPEA